MVFKFCKHALVSVPPTHQHTAAISAAWALPVCPPPAAALSLRDACRFPPLPTRGVTSPTILPHYWTVDRNVPGLWTLRGGGIAAACRHYACFCFALERTERTDAVGWTVERGRTGGTVTQAPLFCTQPYRVLALFCRRATPPPLPQPILPVHCIWATCHYYRCATRSATCSPNQPNPIT